MGMSGNICRESLIADTDPRLYSSSCPLQMQTQRARRSTKVILGRKHEKKITFSSVWREEPLGVVGALLSDTKKEPKPKLLSPDIFRLGRGLPREGEGAKKFGMSLETGEIKLFCRDIPGFSRKV